MQSFANACGIKAYIYSPSHTASKSVGEHLALRCTGKAHEFSHLTLGTAPKTSAFRQTPRACDRFTFRLHLIAQDHPYLTMFLRSSRLAIRPPTVPTTEWTPQTIPSPRPPTRQRCLQILPPISRQHT